MEKFFEFSQMESSLFDFDFQVFDILNTVQTIIKNNETAIKSQKSYSKCFIGRPFE